jgi:hypothetical protein
MLPLTEAEICRTYVVPKLVAAGRDSEPHSIAEQRIITDGRIVPVRRSCICCKLPGSISIFLSLFCDNISNNVI